MYSHNVRVWYSFDELIVKKENTNNSESRWWTIHVLDLFLGDEHSIKLTKQMVQSYASELKDSFSNRVKMVYP